MKLACFLLLSSLGMAQAWTTVCNGLATGSGGCTPGSSFSNARGFNNKLPWDSVNSRLLYYGAPTTNPSIYSSGMWEYSTTSHVMTNRTDNGNTASNPGNCGSDGAPYDAYNPLNGHPQGYFEFDSNRGTAFMTAQLCGGSFMGRTAFYVASSKTIGTALNKWIKSPTCDNQFNCSYPNYQGATFVSGSSKSVFCCFDGGGGMLVVEFNGLDTYTDVSSSQIGSDAVLCSAGTSTQCPPAVLTAQGMVSDGTYLWVYGGCGGTSPGNASPNDCSGTKLNDLYRYTVSTKTWDKMSPVGGTKPPSTNSSFPFFIYDSTNSRFVLYADTNDLWSYKASTNTWTQLTASGSGPTMDSALGAHCDGCMAGYDSANKVMVLMYTVSQSNTPAIFELTLPAITSSASTISGSVTLSGAITLR